MADYPNGSIVLPLTFLNIIKNTTSLAELKVSCCVLAYANIVGLETEELTWTDLLQRTGLTDKSVTEGIRRAVNSTVIKEVEIDGLPHYSPTGGNSPGHVHEHDISLLGFKDFSTNDEEHVHAGKSPVREKLRQVLLNEFGMSLTQRTQRVAYDICLTPKYPVERIAAQIRYTRYEMVHGENGNSSRPIKKPAAWLVHRIRHGAPAPAGFDLLESLEAEGMTRSQIYEAVYNEEINLPKIQESLDYHAWVTGTGAWADRWSDEP